MGKLRVIVWKEVLDIVKDPKFIVGLLVPLFLFPALGAVFSSAAGGVPEKPCIAVRDLDGSKASRLFVEVLSRYASETCGEPVARIIIPKGFGGLLERSGTFNVTVYYLMSSSGLRATTLAASVDKAVKKAASDLFLEIAGLHQRVVLVKKTVYRGRVLAVPPEAFMGIVFGLFNILVWGVFMVAIIAFQLVVVSIASEKEYKTLELLLTQPISSTMILAGKLVASILIALVESLILFVGMAFYIQGVGSVSASRGSVEASAGLLEELRRAGLLPTAPALAAYLALVFASLIFLLSIGVVIGALSSDTKSAGGLSGILVPILVLPALATMFIDVTAFPQPLSTVLLLIPFVSMFAGGRLLLLNNVALLVVSTLATILWAAAFMALAARIYSSETLLTFRAEALKSVLRIYGGKR